MKKILSSLYGISRSDYIDFEQHLFDTLDAWFEWNHTISNPINIDVSVTIEQISMAAISYKDIELMLRNYNLKHPHVKIFIASFQTRAEINTPRLVVTVSPINK